MADETKFTLVEFSKEEMTNISAEISAVLEKYTAQFDIFRAIDDKGAIQTALRIFRRVPLVPKEEGVVSPIQPDDLKENGGNKTEETEAKPDAEAA